MKISESSLKIDNIKNLFSNKDSQEIINISIRKIFKNKIAYVCSFGSESIIILHMISKVTKNLPIIFLNTLKLFDETILYKNNVISDLKFKNIIDVYPEKNDLEKYDINNDLWSKDSEKCCNIRKVLPLRKKLYGFDAWISGRKSFQNNERSKKSLIDLQEEKFIISPLINWSQNNIKDYFEKYKLPIHPLFELGYLSIGCLNCTQIPHDKNNPRSGRWANESKTECGIHKVERK